MEKSIKRVEKLVQATGSTLAQMKLSLMFDDMNEEKNCPDGKTFENSNNTLLEKFLQADDLNLRQSLFKSEASETLAKIDKFSAQNEFNRKNLKPLDRMKEINKRMNHLKIEQSRREDTRHSRQKLLSLINEEKFSPGMVSCKESVESKKIARLNEEKDPSDKILPISRKTDSSLATTNSPIKSKAELKNKILETQEIVDRGFQTARQLAQKVENITRWEKKDQTPSTEKTVSEINLKSLGGKSESNETIKTVKCKRHSERSKKKKADFQRCEQRNTQVIEMRRNEFETDPKSSLQLQHLPSLHIRGGLKVQKIHNLEIPASEVLFEKTNTAISFLSHEQVQREKMEKVLKKVRKENCCCFEAPSNYVECFNCGKLIKIQKNWVDPREIDEILRKCDFNVFDPRIDEYVEKCGASNLTNRCEKTQPAALLRTDPVPELKPEVLIKDAEEVSMMKIKVPKKKKPVSLQDLSDELCRKYKEESEALAENHLKLDAFLENLFRKVEESEEIFETCNLFKNYKSDLEVTPTLTSTRPLLITLPGVSSLNRSNPKKLDKKDVKNRTKSRTEKDFSLAPESFKSTVLSFIHSEQNKSSLQETGEKTQKRFSENKVAKDSDVNKEEAELGFVALASSCSRLSPCKTNSNIKRKKINKTLMMASVQKKNTKHLENKTLGSPTTKSVEEVEERASSVTSSTSSFEERTDFIKTAREPKHILGPVFINNETEKNLSAVSPNKSSNASNTEEDVKTGPHHTSSEKSEINYESDFESFTNEPEEKGDDHENKEPEINPLLKKLSTISEVDSELEKKFSDAQRTPNREGKNAVESLNPKESNSFNSSVSSKTKKTDITSTKTEEGSMKTTPTELVTSLKDILMALQDQFARTESLAEKLTENSKAVKTPVADPMICPWKMLSPTKMVENLQTSRKKWSPGLQKANMEKPRKERNNLSGEEGGSSLGEIIVSEGRKTSSASSVSEESVLNLGSEERSSLVTSGPNEIIRTSGFNLVT